MTTDRATAWSLTINNPTVDDFELLDKARSRGWKVEGQMERGDSGTDHLQLLVRTPQVRFSAMKTAFPRAHIEIARNLGALRNYVAKEETRVASLPEQDNRYPSLNRFWEMIYEEFDVGCEKDGWDLTAEEVVLYRETEQARLDADPLAWLDDITGRFIKKGYFVEHHVVNPAVRAQWKRFHSQIRFRAKAKVLARRQETENMQQTDRQTDSVKSLKDLVLPFIITNADEIQEAHVPTPPSQDHDSPSDSPSS